MSKETVLREYFGHSSFRSGQAALVDAILNGKDVLGIMPTGGGKSICYQVPAIMLEGITIVISPLVSLMQDQVKALCENGIRAAYINSSLTPSQLDKVYYNLKCGMYKIVYVAPERLDTPKFRSAIKSLNVSLLAVDEAHCISQWGNDFRPSYLDIPDFIDEFEKRPVVSAFTATATEEVRRDIKKILKLNNPYTAVTGFDRTNLYFEVQKPKNKKDKLVMLIKERAEKSGIVYCSTRKNVEDVCGLLITEGISATRYHAGLELTERAKNQEDFSFDRKRVMVATNAFGMGIDKSNVNYVIHYNMPASIEAYYQEAGRAGRDGEDAECILLFSKSDVSTAEYFVENGAANENLTEEQREFIIKQDRKRLQKMKEYCSTNLCLRGKLLDYFSEEHEANCKNCSNCLTGFEMMDITKLSQMILSCVVRVNKTLGYYVGKNMIIDVLAGSKSQRITEKGLDSISTYGIVSSADKKYIDDIISYLSEHGYLKINESHKTLEPTKKSKEILFENKFLTMPVRKESKESYTSKSDEFSDNLFEQLKKLRFNISLKEHIPAYMVFSNASLSDMATKKPTNLAEFTEVQGIGRRKAMKYGDEFTELIRKYLDRNK